MTESNQVRDLLLNALQQYSEADNEAKVELAVLALHKGLQDAMRAYLESHGFDEADLTMVSFPNLVDLIRDNTDLFGGDPKLPSLLTSLNTTRTKIAHPGEDKPASKKISQDARQFTRLIHRFWPELFGETYPVSLITSSAKPRREKPIVSEPSARPRPAEPEAQRPSSSKSYNFLQRLWKDRTEPRFQTKLFLKRVMGIVILFTVSKWCKDGAIYTARWPEPIKYVGTAVFLLAVGLFVWGIVNIWKVICQLKLKGLLITFGIGYVLLVGASVLTSDTSLPFHHEVWLATRRLFVSVSRKAHDVGQTLVKAPGEFRFAHTGYRRPVLLPGMNPDDVSYLTPVPANRPAELSFTPSPTSTPHETSVAGSPSPTSVFTPTPIQAGERPGTLPLYVPDCPHPQARLTAPHVNQVIKDEVQVEGTANIENFDYYKFELRREDGDIEDEWHWIESFETPVEEGVLGIWRVSHLPAGIYTFRLTVVNQEGNYPFPPCDVTVQITHR